MADPLFELERLRAENRELRDLLSRHRISIPPVPQSVSVSPGPEIRSQLSPQEKVSLFRRLFRGREDVYAYRWENPDGKSATRSERDWNAYYAARPEDRKRMDKETRSYLPLTDEVIENHLRGKTTIGVYPLLSDETCWFLAADFDKKTWE